MPTLKLETYGLMTPQDVGFCFRTGRTAQFLIDKGPADDEILAMVAKSPIVAAPYGQGWVVRV